jgi:hypothetical protein
MRFSFFTVFEIIGRHFIFPFINLKKNMLIKNPPSIEVIENNLGGTPTENRSTLIPTDLAAIKCPNS